MGAFTRVASAAEVPEGEARGFDAGGARWCVAHLEATLYALGDECPADGCLLSEGTLDDEGGQMVCPCDGSRFDLETGEPVGGPAGEPVAVTAVRVVDGWVELMLG